jgi:O-antigen/teichoic acid export membrane protein
MEVPSPTGTAGPPMVPGEDAYEPDESMTRRHLRGSSLLLLGRLVALGTNFLVQVLMVRYLTKADFGAFAYALAVVSMAMSVNLLGLQRAVSRFVPLFHERRDDGSLAGTLLVAAGSILGFGLALVVLTFGLEGWLTSSVVTHPAAVGLLLILIALAPLEALDSLCQGVVSALASPRAIFFRRHVVGPGLRLGAVLLVMLVEGSVRLLAVCYLAAGILGVLVYLLLILKVLRQQGLLPGFRRGALRLPVRELFAFSLPLMSTDLVLILKMPLAVMVLEYYRGTVSVADFRAVVPVAGLNLIVLQSLKFLFMPTASRLYARGNAAGLTDLYWQSAIWIAILSFPVFAATFFLSEPITVLLFGTRYASGEGSLAPMILSILAVGNYVNAALGLNTYTLQVYARVRFITCINLLSIAAGVLLNLLLIPSLGALGAALATSGSVILYNLLQHVGLFLRTGIDLSLRRGWGVYLSILIAVLVLGLADNILEPSTGVMVALVVLAALAVLRLNRRSLHLAQTFPEVARIPILRRILSLERCP